MKDKKKKTTAKDLPGSGMLKKAGTAIEKRNARLKQVMNGNYSGTTKKKK